MASTMGASSPLLLLPCAAVRKPTVVALGNFDGVHRGHQALLAEAVALAKELGATPYALTFDPHPVRVLAGKEVSLLSTLERRAELVGLAGAAGLLVQPFDAEFARLSPDAFVDGLLLAELGAKGVVVGADFRFGHKRSGDVEMLDRLGRERGITVRCVRIVEDDAGPLGSRRVRQALTDGDMSLATDLLGRPYQVEGLVEQGAQRGRTIGFPTANLRVEGVMIPAVGVYAAYAESDALAPGPNAAVVNIGHRPTLNDGRGLTVEVHVLDANADLYGRAMRVSFIERLRGEERFAGLDELKAAIARDVKAARAILRSGAHA